MNTGVALKRNIRRSLSSVSFDTRKDLVAYVSLSSYSIVKQLREVKLPWKAKAPRG
jgi:hypothetical protein